MTYNLIVTDDAESNALTAAIYYNEQQYGLGLQFIADLEDTYTKIIEHPFYYSYIALQNQFRDISLRRFPYVVIYEVRHNDVIVIDVFHTNRKPLF